MLETPVKDIVKDIAEAPSLEDAAVKYSAIDSIPDEAILAMDEKVRKEIQRHNYHTGRKGLRDYFYGFSKRLPDSRFDNKGGCFYLQHYFKMMQTPFSEIRSVGKEHSDLFMSQTPEGFFNHVLEAIQKSNSSLRDIKDLQGLAFGATMDDVNEEILYKLAFPAYKMLRLLGYNHYPDLTR